MQTDNMRTDTTRFAPSIDTKKLRENHERVRARAMDLLIRAQNLGVPVQRFTNPQPQQPSEQ